METFLLLKQTEIKFEFGGFHFRKVFHHWEIMEMTETLWADAHAMRYDYIKGINFIFSVYGE